MVVKELFQDQSIRKDFRDLTKCIKNEGYAITAFTGENFDGERFKFLILDPKNEKSGRSCAVGEVCVGNNSNIRIRAYGLQSYENMLQIAKEFDTNTKICRDIELELANDKPKYFSKGINTL